MITSFLPGARRFLAVASLFAVSTSLAQASIIYETSFTGSAGPFETAPGYEDWHVQHSVTTVTTSLALDGNGHVLVNNPVGGTGNNRFGGAIYTGNTDIANGQVSGVFQYLAGGNQASGLLARVQNPTGDGNTPGGYFAGILRYNSGSGNKTYLVIAKDIEYANISNFLLASVEISVSSENSYRLEFDFNGKDLSATLFNAAGDLQIKSLVTTDENSHYATGAVGFRASLNQGSTLSFDSFQATAIPEPSTSLLLLPAGIAALHFFRKNNAR